MPRLPPCSGSGAGQGVTHLLERLSSPTPDHGAGTAVHEMIAAQARRTPHAVAAESNGARLTYAELDARAERLAGRLEAEQVGPGVIVGLLVNRSLDMLVGLLAILKAGGAYLPLDPAYPEDRTNFILSDAAAHVLLTEGSAGGQRDATRCPLPTASRALPLTTVLVNDAEMGSSPVSLGARPERGLNASRPPLARHDPDLAYVIYTSGSTGRPKGVAVSHGNLSSFLRAMRRQPGIEADDVVAAATTICFDPAGLELWLPLTVGARVVVVPAEVVRDGARLQGLIEAANVTLLQGTPTTFRLLLESGWSGGPNLRILCGGETLSRELADRLLPCCGSLWNMYGPTETTVWSTVQRVTPGRGPVPIGKPVDNTTVHVLSEDRVPVGDGQEGELYIGGEGVALGYINRPELTRERFIPDPFRQARDARLYRTGDRVRALPDGSLLFLGRMDQQVKIRGFRIEPGEVESALMRHPGVATAAVAAVGEDGKDLRLVAYVVARPGHVLDPAALRLAMGRTLPDYMIPARFVELPALPLTPSGKIDRKALPAPPVEAGVPSVPPGTEVERRLASIWEEFLKVKPIGASSDFFLLGGDSLMAVQLFARIARDFGKDLPAATLVDSPTLGQLARRLEEAASAGSSRPTTAGASLSRSLVPVRRAGSRRPLFFVHGGGGTVLFLHDLAAGLPADRPVYGLQSEGQDGRRVARWRVEQMASHYLEEVRSVQPAGPYLIAGYCFGGLVAFEMARQLQGAGDRVGLLALVNAWNVALPFDQVAARPRPVVAAPLAFPAARLHRRALAALPMAGRLDYLRRAVRDGLAWRLATLRGSAAWLLMQGRLMDLLLLGRRTLPPAWRPVYLAAITERAERAYVPRPYDGSLLLIRGAGLFRDPHMGWSGLARSIEASELGGDQRLRRELVSRPYIWELARELTRRMDELEQADE